MSIPGELKKVKRKTGSAIGKVIEFVGDKSSYSAQKLIHYKFNAYQPLPWIGYKTKKRQKSSFERLEEMQKHMPEGIRSAMDIGCNLGFFMLSLAEKGIFSIGVDTEPGNINIAQYARKKAGIDNCAFTTMMVDPQNVHNLPSVDLVVFFSVWHHWLKAFGEEAAREMLKVLWSHTQKVMYFEAGEDMELRLLNMERDAFKKYLLKMLSDLENSNVGELAETSRGAHKAGDIKRTLYVITRKS